MGFTVSETESISGSPGSECIQHLKRLFGEWVQWTPDTPHEKYATLEDTSHKKYATLEDLKTALCSDTVELGTVADELHSKWQDKRKSTNYFNKLML